MVKGKIKNAKTLKNCMHTVKKIAAYVRPWSIKYFEYFLPLAFDKAEAIFLSDFRGLGCFDWCGRFYYYFNQLDEDIRVPYWLDANQILEIIARSYLLRALSLNEAFRLVRAMSCAIEDTLNATCPDALISPSADSYVMDLLIQHCRHRRIPYCGLIPCPIPGFTRASAIGEFFSFRVPTEEECSKALVKIKDPLFKPIDLTEWLKMYGNSFIYLKRCVREIPKKLYFYLLGKIKNDQKNYHYLGNSISKVSLFSQGVYLKKNFCNQWLKIMRNWSGIRVYLPLQVIPESTTDYHTKNLDLIDFPRLIIRLLKNLATNSKILICVKEHPGMMGARPPNFYKNILNQKNILLISGEVPATSVMSEADVVLLWNGTGGLEGALRGKPVITIGVPYYNFGLNFRSIEDLESFDKIDEIVIESIKHKNSGDDDLKIINHILSGTFPGEFLFINFNKENLKLAKNAQNLAEGLKCFWQAWQTENKAFNK